MNPRQFEEACLREESTLEPVLFCLNRCLVASMAQGLSGPCHRISLESFAVARRLVSERCPTEADATAACDLFVYMHLCPEVVGGGQLVSRVLRHVRQEEDGREGQKEEGGRRRSKPPRPREGDDLLSALAFHARAGEDLLGVPFPSRESLWVRSVRAPELF